MANTQKNTQANVDKELEAEVLYQKLGDRWFAFSIVNDEVFMSPVSDDQIAVAKKEAASYPRDFHEDFDNTDSDETSNPNKTV